MDSPIIKIIVGAMALIFIGLGILLFLQLRPAPAPYPTYASDADDDFESLVIDSGARIEIEMLRSQIEALRGDIERLEDLIRSNSQVQPSPMSSSSGQPSFPSDGNNDIVDAYSQVVLIASRRDLNKGLKPATPRYLESIFGKPRENLTSECLSMTNSRLRDKLVTEEVGPIRVRMLQPAANSLRQVFQTIEAADPDLYARIKSSGSLCVRHIRGAPGRISSHAFGLALDLNIDGRLDQLADGKTQLGLAILADFFRDAGWYWGAGFSREDSMHFEASRDLVERWVSEGAL